MELPTLQELFPGLWSAEQPRTLVELLNSEYGNLDQTSKALRRHTVEAVFSYERAPVLTARNARELLEKHHLPCRTARWTTIVLDANRERVYERREGAHMRLSHKLTTNFPRAERLIADLPLPTDGQYLIVYGGGLEALDEENLRAYQALTRLAPVADVLLWDSQGDTATFWSVRTGRGSRGPEILESPDPETLRRWQAS